MSEFQRLEALCRTLPRRVYRDQYKVTDAERLYPGKGILPLGEMKRRFDGIGYDRMVSIEIFRPEYWEQDPFEVARIAKESTERVLNIGRYAVRGSVGQ